MPTMTDPEHVEIDGKTYGVEHDLRLRSCAEQYGITRQAVIYPVGKPRDTFLMEQHRNGTVKLFSCDPVTKHRKSATIAH